MQNIRKRIFEIIEVAEENDKLSNMYDVLMMMTIVISLVPLAFKNTCAAFVIIDYITIAIFIVDYFIRLITADYKMNNHKPSAFFVYPITPIAIIDLLSILPSISILASGFKILKLFRLFRTLRVFRAFKFIRYSDNITIIMNVFKKQKRALTCVGTLAIAYILISALVIFNIEPDSFNNFFEAIYWATVSLTTMGYGDIYPVTAVGRVVTMVSSMFGIAIVALPSGIITAGYLEEINNR